MNNRLQLVDLLPDNSKGVEIGVQFGEFSEELCKTGKFSELYSIDSWLDNFDDVKYWIDGEILNEVDLSVKKSWTNGDWDTAESVYKKAVDRLGKYPASRVLKMDQKVASDLFEEEYFDFVYIDSAHDEKNVLETILHWFPTVKTNGIIAGDDYADMCGIYEVKNRRKIIATIEVKSVVDSVFPNANIFVHNNGKKQWWVRKES